MSFSHKLRQVQQSANSLVCVGLDPDLTRMPKHLLRYGNPALEFNRQIIEKTHDLVCAYKLNLAFYEALGEPGWRTIKQTLECIPSHIVTIADGKRGDIGNTAAMYARSVYDELGFDACTVNPYMGFDSVEPFLRDENRCAFVLALTSNPGARDFEYLRVKGKPLYEHVIARVKKWNVKKNCGLVVGATRPKELRRIRALAPSMPILIPGIGTQGGDLVSAVRFGCDRSGRLALLNSSRDILYASDSEDSPWAAREAARRLRDNINEIRARSF